MVKVAGGCILKEIYKYTPMFQSLHKLYFYSRFLLAIFGTSVFIGGALGFPPVSQAETALPQETLADLVKPSVVRIAVHIRGSAKVPKIKVDIRKHLVATVPNEYVEVPVDEYMLGSGFIVHPDGYIATSAHVVSEETVKQMLASDSALSALYENALFLSDAEIQEFIQSEGEDSFSRQVIKYVIEHSAFKLDSQLAVLRPVSEKININDLMNEGFPAEKVSVNDNFLDDEKDAALIKIAENNLPAISLANEEELAAGARAYIFGFPATAELNRISSSEATFTQGIISAIRQSTNRDFKIFQTDAKVSEGSSGGPLLNERGEVTGIITFQTGELNRAQGDNFAFALPISLIKEMARAANVPLAEGVYNQFFKRGLTYFAAERCDKALDDFRAAAGGSNGIFVKKESLDTYIKKCEALQARGNIYIFLDKWRHKIEGSNNLFFYFAGIGLMTLGILAAILFWILRLIRREEQEIEMLETRLRMDEVRIKGYDNLPRGDKSFEKKPEKKKRV